jgi:hypothetical protein
VSAAAGDRVPGFVRPYLKALWDAPPPALAMLPERAPRAVLAAGTVHLPRLGPVDAAPARRLRLATSAHLGAHLAYGRGRVDRASLKPVQLVLLGLLEDARVEWLAAQSMPGLRALWLEHHLAGPASGSDFETLLARLAHALLDPGWQDPHPWVLKGRALFFADARGGRLALPDALALRKAASLLGNDVGQMRLRFNDLSYLVQPAYRDDNSHLWRFDEELPPSSLVLDAPEEQSARAGEGAQDGSVARDASAGIGAELAAPPQAARETPGTDPGVFTYSEWDRLIGRYRKGWVTVCEEPQMAAAAPGAVRALRDRLDAHAGLMRRLRQRLLRGGGLLARALPRRSADGEVFHLPSLVDAMVSLRMRASPEPRVYLGGSPGVESWAVMLLVDSSASTARPADACGNSVLDQARLAALACAAAFEAAGHRCAIQAFASEGRGAVRMSLLKDFGERSDAPQVIERTAALASGLSTRIGAAVRHGAAALARRPETRRFMLLLTDGEPHDIDVHDSRYLLEDLRIASQDAGRRGVRVGCLNLDAGAPRARRDALKRAFPAGCCRDVQGLQALPDALLAVLSGAPR